MMKSWMLDICDIDFSKFTRAKGEIERRIVLIFDEVQMTYPNTQYLIDNNIKEFNEEQARRNDSAHDYIKMFMEDDRFLVICFAGSGMKHSAISTPYAFDTRLVEIGKFTDAEISDLFIQCQGRAKNQQKIDFDEALKDEIMNGHVGYTSKILNNICSSGILYSNEDVHRYLRSSILFSSLSGARASIHDEDSYYQEHIVLLKKVFLKGALK